MTNTEIVKSKPDLFDRAMATCRVLKLIFFDAAKEIYVGCKTRSIPTYLCLIIGILINGSLLIYLDGWIFALFHKQRLLIPVGSFRDWIGIISFFSGFYGWGIFRVWQRIMTTRKLNKAWKNAGLETKLKEMPTFHSDYPIDDFARKLTVRTGGLSLDSFKAAKSDIESNLNVNITKMESPKGNKEFVDIIYSPEMMPDLWCIENMSLYKNFSFPIGKSIGGEIIANFRDIPHFLIAGESGAGKSTFIRMMLTVLLQNNSDEIEVYHLDFKEGMESQIFSNFDSLKRIDNIPTAATALTELKTTMESRMSKFKSANARSLEMYNKTVRKAGEKEKRIIVVVDEASELMPTFRGNTSSDLAQVNSVLNKIARMGRAVGIHLVIGVQKPDGKNLDPTIKANLSGIVCFAVSHFTQSTVVLGNSRAADLNIDFPGRAIWKHGLELAEVQAPLLLDEDIEKVRVQIAGRWRKNGNTEVPAQGPLVKKKDEKIAASGMPALKNDLEVESLVVPDSQKTLL
jgi:energy-coupling factor transporter ATP-binding protein EcfA2